MGGGLAPIAGERSTVSVRVAGLPGDSVGVRLAVEGHRRRGRLVARDLDDDQAQHPVLGEGVRVDGVGQVADEGRLELQQVALEVPVVLDHGRDPRDVAAGGGAGDDVDDPWIGLVRLRLGRRVVRTVVGLLPAPHQGQG